MTICKNCNNEIMENSTYCNLCGAEVVTDTTLQDSKKYSLKSLMEYERKLGEEIKKKRDKDIEETWLRVLNEIEKIKDLSARQGYASTAKLNFRFYEFYTKYCLLYNTALSGILSFFYVIILIILSFIGDQNYERNNFIATIIPCILSFLINWILYNGFRKERKSTFKVFIITLGIGFAFLSVGTFISFAMMLPLLICSIPSVFLFVYMFKRRKMFTIGTPEYEAYKNYNLDKAYKIIKSYTNIDCN